MKLLAILVCLITSFGSLSVHADESKPRIVMLIAEREYETHQTLPAFAKQSLEQDFDVSFVFEDPADRNRFVGIEQVDDADVVVISVRRRTLPKTQLDTIRRHVASGKPVVGIRTANHAFCLRTGNPPDGYHQWTSWDHDVFGGSYTNHYGNDLVTTVTCRDAGEVSNILLKNIDTDKSFTSTGSLYVVSPIAEGTTVLMDGKVEGQGSEPIAWTFTRADGGKSFYTSLGHKDDFAGDVLPKLLVNALDWLTP
ncbi:Trehalose utilization [Planctomycetes bacterium CA13]|uniref:Trehalose utilization n=1 Tax=Novipirellula herctigrandis TaxID=2527986 RepID=A0A5C5Z7L6_9BACT|nr:Trehalose utilization [Planctomycetes bacterium CA13]